MAVDSARPGGHERLMAAALRDATVRAGSASVGTPVRVVCDGQAARVEFTHREKRVCPVSRQEHRSSHFSVVLRPDERTGLPALFVSCFSADRFNLNTNTEPCERNAERYSK